MKQQAIDVLGAAALPADSRAGQPHGSRLHQILPANDVSAGGGNSAAGVLNQGTGHNVGSYLRGLDVLHKLAVAVVHEHQNIRIGPLGGFNDLADLPHGQRRTEGIAPGALDHQELCMGLLHRPADFGDIRTEILGHVCWVAFFFP